MWGYGKKEELLGRPVLVMVENGEETLRHLGEVQKKGGWTGEEVCKRKDGSTFTVQTLASLIRDKDGMPICMQASFADISSKKQAEKALAEKISQLRTIVDAIPDSVYLKDKEGRFILNNRAHMDIIGKSDFREVIGKTDSDVFPEEFLKSIYEDEQKVLRTGKPMLDKEELLLDRKKNKKTFFLASKTPIMDSKGKIAGLVGISRDITKQKRVEEKFKESQYKLGERIKELDCLYGISKLVEKPGISFEEIFKGTVKFIPPGWQYPDITCARIITPDGEFKTDDFKDTTWKLKDDINLNGKIYGTLEVCYLEEKPEDYEGPFLKEERNLINAITDQLERTIVSRQTQKMLADNEARFKELFKNMSSGVTVYEASGDGNDFIIRDINRAGEKRNRVKKKDLIGRSLKDIFPEAKEHGTLDVFKEVYKTGKPCNYPIKIYKDNKISVWVENYLYKLPTGEIVSIYDDVTEQKLAEEEILRLSKFPSENPNPILRIDEARKVIYSNQAGKKQLESLGVEVGKKAPPILYNEIFMPNGERSTRTKIINVQVGERLYEFVIAPVKGSDYTNLYGRDITEKKRAEEALQEKHNQLNTIINNIPDPVFLKDKKSTFILVNKATINILGKSNFSEVIGKSDFDFYPKEMAMEFYSDDQRTMKTGKPVWHKEELVFNKKSNKNVNLITTKIPLFDSGGNVTGLVGISSDVSKLKEASEELAISNKELAAARKESEASARKAVSANKTKSEFLSNMSHEIRTPMNAIMGFSELLESQVEDLQQKQYLASILSSGKTLLALINDILDLSKIEAGKIELQYAALNPQNLFDEIGRIFSVKVKEKGLEFLTEIDDKLPKALHMDEVRIRQILFNIVGNAVKFTSSGYVKLRVKGVYFKDKSKIDLIFSVKDTGIGITDEDKEIIFDAFRQSKKQRSDKYGGTGLGLSITKRLIEMMEGSVSVESTAGKGSIFTVKLKNVVVASVEDISEEQELTFLDDIKFSGQTVLAVDDIKSNRMLIKETLKPYNLNVLRAEKRNQADNMDISIRP